MLQILASGVAPLPAIDVIAIPSTDSPARGWFVLAVPRSTRAPHAVVVNEGFRFPVRNGTTIRYLSEPELAAEYRRRDQRSGQVAETLTDLAASTLGSVARNEGPWVLVAMVPEYPGMLEINQAQLRRMQQAYVGRDLFDVGRSGAHFEWVRTGRGRYRVGDGPYPNASSPLPHYGYAELHINGAGSYAVRLVDMADARRQNTGMPLDPNADQMVSDEVMTLSVLTGLHRLASHARDMTGAAGSAIVQVHLAPSPGRAVLIGHTRQHGFADSRSGNSLVTAAVAETAAALDELAQQGPTLAATGARLIDEVGTSFGIAEMGQLSQEGEVRRRYWRDPSALVAWAERFDVSVTDTVISDA